MIHQYVKSAAQVHSENACKGIPGATDASDAHVMGILYQGLGKRKATFDRDEFKRRMDQVKAAKITAEISREARLETCPPEEAFR